VIINLIGNSLKFTKEGGISINLEKTENLLKVVVSDTGIGISEKNQSRLFRKFQQAGEDMIARDVTQGTGLGLYISQLLVTAMGGTIGLVKSELGKGSTFAFTVPIVS
jgi:signal transduction histidine kinase